MEHLQHFALGQDPFQNEPDLRFYFECQATLGAKRRLERGLRQSKGLSVLTGAGGVGKTLLARRLYESLEDEVFESVMMVMLPGAADAHSTLVRVARQLGVEEPAGDRSALVAQVYEQLAVVREDGRHAILIIDNAHLMDRSAVAEVGGLLNLEYEERRLLSLLLVGLPELDTVLGHDASLGQCVDVRVHLESLDPSSAAAYLAHRLAHVGGRPEIIPAPALEALYKLGRGRPRLMNTLADNALFEAFLAGRPAMEPADVERAAADLGVGSDPGSTYTGAASATGSGSAEDPVTGELTDPRGPALDAPSFVDDDASSDDELELSQPIPDHMEIGADRTTVLEMNDAEPGGTRDLDAAVADMLDEAPVEADPRPGLAEVTKPDVAQAEATRVEFADEPQDAESEIDDLFVELVED